MTDFTRSIPIPVCRAPARMGSEADWQAAEEGPF
jgi:hypothetical protein